MTSKRPINLKDPGFTNERSKASESSTRLGGIRIRSCAPSLAFANDFENLGDGYVVIGQDCDEMGILQSDPAYVSPKIELHIKLDEKMEVSDGGRLELENPPREGGMGCSFRCAGVPRQLLVI